MSIVTDVRETIKVVCGLILESKFEDHIESDAEIGYPVIQSLRDGSP
jgi:hypothetical protein